MKKNLYSNSITATEAEQTVTKNKQKQNPSKLTLDFVKQFARNYHFEPRLHQTLGDMLPN